MTQRYALLFSFILAWVLACPQVVAQDDADDSAATDAPEARQPEFFTFETAGFAFDFELFNEPVVRETSNSSIYAVTIQRRAGDGLALGTDGQMSFIRLSQTIYPLDEVGTIEDMRKATIDDAVLAINNAYGDVNRLNTTPASYEILGEVREGVRIDVGYLANLGVSVYVECYTFESENGHAVGLTIKYHERDDGEVSRDVILADQFLAGLEVLQLTPESSYTHSLGGYPIRIPVRSSIQSGRRLNQFVTEATIAYQNGSLRLQMIQVPEDANKQRIARDQLRGYQGALKQQRDRGEIEILSESVTTVPAGESGDAILTGLTHAIRMNGQEFISTMYTAVDERLVLMASISGSTENAEALSSYAREFFKRPLSSASTFAAHDAYKTFSFRRPRGLSVIHNPAAPGFEFILSSAPDSDWDAVRASPAASDGSHTHVKLVDSDQDAIDTVHDALIQEFKDPFTHDASIEPELGTVELIDGRIVPTRTSRVTVLVEDNEPQTLIIVSYMLDDISDQSALIVSSIANTQAHGAQSITTRSLLNRFEQHTRGPIDLGFGVFTPTEDISRVSRHNSDVLNEMLIARMGEDSITIRVRSTDTTTSADGDTAAYMRFLRNDWGFATRDLEESALPDDLDGIQISNIAGYDGHAQEAVFESDDSGSPIRVRAIGFQHNSSYVTVTIRTHGEQSLQAADQLLGLVTRD